MNEYTAPTPLASEARREVGPRPWDSQAVVQEVFRQQGILSRQRKPRLHRQEGGIAWAVEATGIAPLVGID